MRLTKQPTIKKALLLFGVPVIGSATGNAIYEYLIAPAIPILPKVPFILYSIFATAFAVLFLLGLVATAGQLLAKGWRHLTIKDLRNNLIEKVRTWPTSKWDLLPVIATTYFVATMLPLVAALLVLPEKQLVGVVTQKQFANMSLVVFTPMMVVFIVMMGRWAFEAYKEMTQRWASGTRSEKITFATSMASIMVAWVFMMAGDLAGWGDLLWMSSTYAGG